jgi:nucleoside-diphosphate-sugar epimerase
LAAKQARNLGFRKFIISATTPFAPSDMTDLRINAPSMTQRRVPDYVAEYARRGWKMVPTIDRVYVNDRAREELGWKPRYDFRYVLDRLKAGEDFRSPLARVIGSKGYHSQDFAEGPYSVKC